MKWENEIWYAPPRMHFSWGGITDIGNYLNSFNSKNVLLITDSGVESAGVLDQVFPSLDSNDINYCTWSGVESDPSDKIVHRAADKFTKFNADSIIGIGGGSTIDTAKAVGVLANNGRDILSYTSNQIHHDVPTSIYVPTTSGTGSEVGNWTIIKDSNTGIKQEIGDVKLLPDLALIDPSLTASVPSRVKAYTGMDALTHAIEAYVSVNAQSPTSALSLDSIEKIGVHLPRVVHSRNLQKSSLCNMARASMQAGMAFNGAGLGAVHAISHQIGTLFEIPHGLANAIMLPYVMEYNLPQVPELMIDIANALGESVDTSNPTRREASKAISAVRRLADTISIPRSLSETSAERGMIPTIAERALQDGCIGGNPRATDQSDIEMILHRSFDG